MGLLYLRGNGLACLLCFYSRNRRTLHTLATLPVIARDYGIFPLYTSIRLLICFNGVVPIKVSTNSSFESVPVFSFIIISCVNKPFKRRKRRKYLRVIQILNRSSLFVKAAQIDIVPDGFLRGKNRWECHW